MKEQLRQYLIKKMASMLSERRAVPSLVLARNLEESVKEDLRECLAELEQDNIVSSGMTLNDRYFCLNEAFKSRGK